MSFNVSITKFKVFSHNLPEKILCFERDLCYLQGLENYVSTEKKDGGHGSAYLYFY